MNFKKALVSLICVALAVSCFAQMKMAPRGKAELSCRDRQRNGGLWTSRA